MHAVASPNPDPNPRGGGQLPNSKIGKAATLKYTKGWCRISILLHSLYIHHSQTFPEEERYIRSKYRNI